MGEGRMMRIYLVAPVAALALISCGSEANREDSRSADDRRGEYTIDPETGERTMTVDTPEGAVQLRSGPDVAIDLPAGFTVMDTARIIENTVVDQADGKGALILFETDEPPEDVAAFYRDQAEAAGIELEIDTEINGNRMLGGKADSGITFSLGTSATDSGTRAQLVVGEGEDY